MSTVHYFKPLSKNLEYPEILASRLIPIWSPSKEYCKITVENKKTIVPFDSEFEEPNAHYLAVHKHLYYVLDESNFVDNVFKLELSRFSYYNVLSIRNKLNSVGNFVLEF